MARLVLRSRLPPDGSLNCVRQPGFHVDHPINVGRSSLFIAVIAYSCLASFRHRREWHVRETPWADEHLKGAIALSFVKRNSINCASCETASATPCINPAHMGSEWNTSRRRRTQALVVSETEHRVRNNSDTTNPRTPRPPLRRPHFCTSVLLLHLARGQGLSVVVVHVLDPPSAASSDLWVDAAARTLMFEPHKGSILEPTAAKLTDSSSRPLSSRSTSLGMASEPGLISLVPQSGRGERPHTDTPLSNTI